ncbi:hypothetical protein QFZ65_000648 [Arthrobacter sp. B3I9]|uniref:hypothetical protein n=1 Tax=Arthrobacter sp. B3I9 TaxID=3042270 RepID=UPI00278D10C9|nr:hypothetical protein [Arthrobacter sp. B3I9]MDQ0848710.1 hypothetical protein [Arthrobacter sp. B3I9]
METAEQTYRSAEREYALQQAPGRPVIVLRPVPVTVRAVSGNAIAYTVTHVLVERDAGEEYSLRWEASWQVKRLAKVS